MPGSGYQDPTGITVDDGSMEEDAGAIDAEQAKLSNNLASLPPDISTITAKKSGEEAYKRSQDLVDLFKATLTQDIQNIIAVKDAFKSTDTEIQNEIESLSSYFEG